MNAPAMIRKAALTPLILNRLSLPKIRVKSSPYFADIAYCMSRVKQGSLQSVPQTNLPLHAQNLEAIVKQYIVTIEIRADGCPISEKIPVRISWDYDINCNCFPNYNRFYV